MLQISDAIEIMMQIIIATQDFASTNIVVLHSLGLTTHSTNVELGQGA